MTNSKNPKITVYVVSHNYGDYLEQAVESVLRQTVDDWEILIIDDNSSDNTREIMNLYKGDKRIRLYTTQGIGLPAVCNLAIQEANGEYIIRLDGDDVFDDNILLVLSNWLDRHHDYAMVFPDYYFIDEQGNVFGQERRMKVYDRNHMLDMPANGACCLIRSKALLEVGGYRDDLGAQDGYDIWNKLIYKYKCGNVNIPLFYYRKHSKNLTNNTDHILNARRSIKLDTISSKLINFRPIIAVIPCREMYDFCTNVWEQNLFGKSLLQHNIEKNIQSELFDYIVVASDTEKVRDTIRLYNDPRLSFFKRHHEETLRSTTIAVTLERLIKELDPQLSGLTVLSYIQSPFVTKHTLEEAISTLILNDADCSMGVEEISNQVFIRTPHGLQPINPPRGLKTDFDMLYCEANTSLATRNKNIKKGTLTNYTIVHYIVSKEECFFIDSTKKLMISNILAENT